MPSPVRVLLCTSGGVHGASVLRALRASDRVQVAGIVRSTRVLSARYGFLRGVWEQCRRSGVRYALFLGITAGARFAARAQCIPVLATRDVNAPEGRDFVERLAPELIVSAFFNQRIGEAIVALPRFGAVNIHPSLLPAFRGVDPVFFAMLRGAPRGGVTLHRIAPELDAGAIIGQHPVPFAPGESVLLASARLFACGADLLLASLGRIVAGDAGAPQTGAANYDSWPTAAQVAELRRRGVPLLDWRDLRAVLGGRLST